MESSTNLYDSAVYLIEQLPSLACESGVLCQSGICMKRKTPAGSFFDTCVCKEGFYGDHCQHETLQQASTTWAGPKWAGELGLQAILWCFMFLFLLMLVVGFALGWLVRDRKAGQALHFRGLKHDLTKLNGREEKQIQPIGNLPCIELGDTTRRNSIRRLSAMVVQETSMSKSSRSLLGPKSPRQVPKQAFGKSTTVHNIDVAQHPDLTCIDRFGPARLNVQTIVTAKQLARMVKRRSTGSEVGLLSGHSENSLNKGMETGGRVEPGIINVRSIIAAKKFARRIR